MERFSKSQIVRAGKLISGFHPEATNELAEAYKTAYKWRDAHVYPMRVVRNELGRIIGKANLLALTAGRLKRMQSIRRKLRKGRSLYQIQDISGCRGIVASMAGLRALQTAYLDGQSKYEVIGQDDYIATPKADGYRSHHLVVKFEGPAEQTGDNRLVVEVQLRTRLQHAWATAVEAVGFVRRENLKAREGSPEWLRLFQLMSGEIAAMEGAAVPSTCPANTNERREELRELDERLGAIKSLESYSQAIRYAENYLGRTGNSYLIRYDLDTHEVRVTTFSQFSRASKQYIDSERSADTENAVLVEVDGVEELKSAYPNYFLDVRAFTDRLKIAVYGSRFVLPQEGEAGPPRPRKYGDLSFLSKWKK